MLDLMENPRLWHKWIYVAVTAAGYYPWYHNPGIEPLEWLGKAALVFGVSACVANDMACSSVKWKEAWIFKTHVDPDFETKALAAAKERARQADMSITTGNVNIAVPVASGAKKQIHPEMVSHQFVVTSPRLDEYHSRLTLKKICKRQMTYYLHPELGHPYGDYREQTWLSQCTRRELKVCLGILEYNGGIARKGSAKNSPYETVDISIIREAAQGTPLPHPKDCECENCAVK